MVWLHGYQIRPWFQNVSYVSRAVPRGVGAQGVDQQRVEGVWAAKVATASGEGGGGRSSQSQQHLVAAAHGGRGRAYMGLSAGPPKAQGLV